MFSLFAHGEGELRVGIYQNSPSVFYDDTGKVQGFFIDVLEYTAKAEGWELDYVKDTWPRLIELLDSGGIDMIAGMAFSEERDKLYDFTTEPVFINWGQVYVQNEDIQSILDLRDRTVVGLRKDIYGISFQKLLKQFRVPVNFIEVNSYADVMRFVENGIADAGITSRSIGKLLESQFQVFRSPIICCSKEVHYSTPKGEGKVFLDGLNRQIKSLKKNSSSFYFKSLDYWYGQERTTSIPDWLVAVLGSSLFALLVLLGGVVILRQQVRERTAKLEEAQTFLESRVEQRTAELYEMNQQLKTEINDHHETQKKLQHMVRHDPLTGLPNRRWFAEHLLEDIKRAKRTQRQLAVLFLDLDGFKETNDSYGHDLGDMVLIGAAERIRECLRATDKLARLGGDEFIVILPEIRMLEAATIVADKILSRFTDPFQFDDCSCVIGVSIGISLFPDHGEEPEILLNHADHAMYASKNAGRNRFTLYSDKGLNLSNSG